MLPLRLTLAALAVAALSACYTGSHDLLPEYAIIAPWQKITYQHLYSGEDAHVLTRDGTTYFEDMDGSQQSMRIMPVRENWYVVEIHSLANGDDAGGPYYGYVHVISDGLAEVYGTNGTAEETAPGITPCGSDACIDDISSYIAYMDQRIAGGLPSEGDYSVTLE
ncbi:MAG TPA: hypothetical protein VG894_11430 [Bauldia sp.]|nr:hypothetical protein [Bauldia sp.]